MKKKPAFVLAPVTHCGLFIRRKEYNAVVVAFDAFASLQRTLLIGLDGDIASFEREIAAREELKKAAFQVN